MPMIWQRWGMAVRIDWFSAIATSSSSFLRGMAGVACEGGELRSSLGILEGGEEVGSCLRSGIRTGSDQIVDFSMMRV